ncbi:hypothetical protein D1Z90_11410 [Motilimonas pumila]|uniref:Uncharacterized protein n=2 Tax=Motilimonas pumila TaxID=2303987 RepID=A0A418YEF1_9GAMM|nr:hypothetical protein D1Z90_11410 [Motilimonas pumila]
MNTRVITTLALAFSGVVLADAGHHGHIQALANENVNPSFDLVHAKIEKGPSALTFQAEVTANIGKLKPNVNGQLAGAQVYSYVWPTSLDSEAVGFEKGQGILALAVTAHPDFDDTPQFDENADGDKTNDGNEWHSHWVVLTKDAACPGGLKVKDIPEGQTPKVPVTWPGLPIYLDSPGYAPEFTNDTLTVDVPTQDLAGSQDFQFDAVTSVLQVNASVHNPLLCVTQVQDIASGDLSLPGEVVARH